MHRAAKNKSGVGVAQEGGGGRDREGNPSSPPPKWNRRDEGSSDPRLTKHILERLPDILSCLFQFISHTDDKRVAAQPVHLSESGGPAQVSRGLAPSNSCELSVIFFSNPLFLVHREKRSIAYYPVRGVVSVAALTVCGIVLVCRKLQLAKLLGYRGNM